MRKLIADPLIHFLLVGAALFAALSWLSDDSDPRRIRLTAEQVRTAMRNQLPQGDGAPTRSELEAIIEPLIQDEVFYREALALGLDTDDDQVRTRLIEKMRYVSEDLADPEPAQASQLRELFDAAPERFAAPEAVTFEHVYFSPSQRGDAVAQDADAALAALRAGSPASGDSTPLGDTFAEATRDRLEILFGAEMTAAVFELPADVWSGPFESDFGLHLVRVTQHRRARQPAFEEVEAQVREAFAEDRRLQRNAEAWAQMRERYEILIEWPDELSVAN